MTMRLNLHGGFGEKGRTSVGIECDGYRLLLDAGVKTSARGRDEYYPAISAAALQATDAIVVTHGHEDHAAALGWCIAQGFRGRVFMTPETQRDSVLALAGYATADEQAYFRQAKVERLPVGEDALSLGPLTISTGRSGYIAGGVWCRVDARRVRFGYCGDVVPASPIFAMDPLRACTAIAIDASYGDDDIPATERAAQVGAWIAANPQGYVLPTPLYGRSAELLAIVPGPVALAPGMRDALAAQIDGAAWLVEGTAEILAVRLDAAAEWKEGAPLPRAALLCHDGMGMAGPSRAILRTALAQSHPTLFTGHLPNDSPGEAMVAQARAAWIRLPTHPTLSENVKMVGESGAMLAIGHSCDREMLEQLAQHMPSLRTDLATGDTVEL